MNIDYGKILTAVQASSKATGAHTQAWPLIQAWVKRFHDIDVNFTVVAVEAEMFAWLDEATLLVGQVDLICDSQDRGFFGEWKTANPRGKKSNWQREWQLSTQALTYQVLTKEGKVYGNTGLKLPEMNRYLVRRVYKSVPASCDFEWFGMKSQETEFWRKRLIQIGSRIREMRRLNAAPWMTNFSSCFKFGEKYACPYFLNNCSKMNFTGIGGVNEICFEKRVSHLSVERDIGKGSVGTLQGTIEDLVVLDATRVGVFLDCEERYRKHYEEDGGLVEPAGEALLVGSAFHAGVAEYYRQIKGER